MLGEQRLRLLRLRLRLWLQLGRELEAWGRRIAAAGVRWVEAVVQQPVHGGRGALGGPRGLQGRALVLRAAVAHARDRRGGARAPAQAASLEVTVGRPPVFRSTLGLALPQPRRRGSGLAAPALLPSSRRRPHVFGELGPARRACCSRPQRIGIARRYGNLRGPRPGSPPPPHPQGRATSNAASSPPRPVPATEHAQSYPPPPPTSFNVRNEVLGVCEEEIGGTGFVWRSEPKRVLGEVGTRQPEASGGMPEEARYLQRSQVC